MLLLALLAGSAALLYQYQTTRRALAYWGPDQAKWIRDAETVELCWLEPLVTLADRPAELQASAAADRAEAGDERAAAPVPSRTGDESGTTPEQEVLRGAAGETWRIVDRQSVVMVAGLSHLRHALLQDESYDWSQPAALPSIDADVAFLFAAEGGRVVILMDRRRAWLRDARQSGWQSVVPISAFLERFMQPLPRG
jgi:hypothetical protein